MVYDKEALKSALEQVRPGLANKELVEQSTSFVFMNARVVTFNDEISVSCPLPGWEIEGAVKAETLYKFLGKATGKEIEIEADEGEMRLKAGRSRIGLAFQTEIRLPLDEVDEIGQWHLLPDDFKEAVNFVRFSVAKDFSKPLLTGINIRDTGIVEGGCGTRATRFEMKKVMPVGTFLIPGDSAAEMLKYDVKEISLTERWVHFKTKDGTVFSSFLFAEEYPSESFSRVMQLDNFVEISFPAELTDVLNRAGAVFEKSGPSGKQDASIELKKKKNRIFVQAASEDGTEWFKEWVKCPKETADSDDFTVLINPHFLLDILKRSNAAKIEVESRIKFEGENWEHVAALQRLQREM